MNEKTDNNITIQITHLESIAFNEQVGKKGFERFFERCNIHFHHKRKRLADTDGCSHKATIDGIVASGILKDDSAEFVKKISRTQEKINAKENPDAKEETIIIIEEVIGDDK